MNDIYRSTVLELNKNPINYGILANANCQESLSNHMCGDMIILNAEFDELNLKNSKNHFLKQIKFHGKSCAVTKASASLMILNIKGKNSKQINKLIDEFDALLEGKCSGVKSNLSKELKIFDCLHQYPSRKSCAFLPWKALSNMLKRRNC